MRRRKQGKSGQITRMMSYKGGLKLEGKYEGIGIFFMSPLSHFSDIAECAQATATSSASAANTTATKQRRSASSGGKRCYFDPRPVFVIMAQPQESHQMSGPLHPLQLQEVQMWKTV